MAQKIKVNLYDDITGELIEDGAGETLCFGVDGYSYEIDLATEGELGADALREALAQYVEKARRTGGRSTRPRFLNNPQEKNVKASTVNGSSEKDWQPATAPGAVIREWAQTSEGRRALKTADIPVPGPRGRIARDLVDLWLELGSPRAGEVAATVPERAQPVRPLKKTTEPEIQEPTEAPAAPEAAFQAEPQPVPVKPTTPRPKPAARKTAPRGLRVARG